MIFWAALIEDAVLTGLISARLSPHRFACDVLRASPKKLHELVRFLLSSQFLLNLFIRETLDDRERGWWEPLLKGMLRKDPVQRFKIDEIIAWMVEDTDLQHPAPEGELDGLDSSD